MTREYLFLVAGMTLISLIPRVVPLVFLSRVEMPAWLKEWLDLVPVAILGALLSPALFVHGASGSLQLFSLKVIVALPTFAVAFYSRSLGLTIVTGMLLYWAAGAWLAIPPIA